MSTTPNGVRKLPDNPDIVVATNQAIDDLEQLTSGLLVVTELAAGNHTLTADQLPYGTYEIPVLSADRTLTFPDPLPGKKFIIDNSAGGFEVTVKVDGETGVTILDSQVRWLICGSTDIKALSSAAP